MEERYINHFQLGADAYEYVGDPHLKPEANHQVELSVGKKSDQLNLNASVFYSYIIDYITAAVDTTRITSYNVCYTKLLRCTIENKYINRWKNHS